MLRTRQWVIRDTDAYNRSYRRDSPAIALHWNRIPD